MKQPQCLSIEDRPKLRQYFRQLRQHISDTTAKLAAQQLSQQFSAHPWYQNSQHIAVYLAFDGELDPCFLIEQARADQKQCYLPILNPDQSKTLLFMPYNIDTPLQKNRFGILEPIFDQDKACLPQDMDLTFTPLVAFDNQGNRLGMGAGYYDRSFEFLQEKIIKQQAHHNKLIGVAYECQKADSIHQESWDVPMDGTITEKHTYIWR